MSTDWSKHRYTLIAVPVLALLLLASGCGKQESAAPEQAPAAEAPAEEVTAEAPAPAAEAPQPATEMAEPAAEMAAPVAEAAAPAEAATEAAADATAAAAAVVDGEAIYKQSCMACHAAGVAGAPKLGDSEAWSPRIAKGTDALVQSVAKGLNAMPPKGGCMTCSDEELRGAVEYMVSQ